MTVKLEVKREGDTVTVMLWGRTLAVLAAGESYECELDVAAADARYDAGYRNGEASARFDLVHMLNEHDEDVVSDEDLLARVKAWIAKEDGAGVEQTGLASDDRGKE